MMKTCSAPMRNNSRRLDGCSAGLGRGGVTLTELLVAMVIIALFLAMTVPNLFAVLRKRTIDSKVQDLVSTMQMAAAAAAESDRRYEVIIDLTEQNYMLRQITTPDLSEILEEEIIVDNVLGDNCWFAYVEFDDGDYTNDGQAKFRAGHCGWQYGGKIVLVDENDRYYSIIVNRINRMVVLKQDDVPLMIPKSKNELPF